MPDNLCDLCGTTGTAFRCDNTGWATQTGRCDWDLCASCHGPARVDSQSPPFWDAVEDGRRQIFVPVVPLFEALLSPAAAGAAAAEPEVSAALVGLPAGPPSGSPVLPMGDVNSFLAEQRRSAAEVFGLVAAVGGLPAASVGPDTGGDDGLQFSVGFTDADGDSSTIELEAEAAVATLRCPAGHGLALNANQARLTANCDGCGATGTTERCSGGCDYDLCARCCAGPTTSPPVRRLSWHSGGQCYIESIGILEYDEATGTITAPEHERLIARIVDPPAGPACDELLRNIARMATAAGGVHLRGFRDDFATQAEPKLVLAAGHMQDVLRTWALAVDYVEAMLWQQVVAAVGKQLGTADFTQYMHFHSQRLFRPAYRPAPFSFPVRRSAGHTPEGALSIEAVGGALPAPCQQRSHSNRSELSHRVPTLFAARRRAD